MIERDGISGNVHGGEFGGANDNVTAFNDTDENSAALSDAVAPQNLYDSLTKQEKRWYIFGALKAAILLWGVITAGTVLFVLFCVFVWWK